MSNLILLIVLVHYNNLFFFFRLYRVFVETLDSLNNLIAVIIHKKHRYLIKSKKVGIILLFFSIYYARYYNRKISFWAH